MHGEVVATGTVSAQRFVPGMEIPKQWWELFHSQKLNTLVEESLKANSTGVAAQAALHQAQELYLAQRGSYFPTLQAGFGATRAKNPNDSLTNPTVSSTPTYNLFTAALALSYSPDVFGATRRTVEAAKATEEGTRYQLEATYLKIGRAHV